MSFLLNRIASFRARVDLSDDLLSFSSFLILYYRDFRVILKSVSISILIKSMAQSHPGLGKGVFCTMLCYGAQEDRINLTLL